MENNLQQQAAVIAQVIEQQAATAEQAMVAQGKALIDQMAQQAMVQAQVAAAGQIVLHAQEVLAAMASAATSELNGMEQLAPVEIEPFRVIELKPVPMALPATAAAALPPAARMLNAAVPTSTAAAKRRARRKAAQTSEVQQG